MKAINEKLNGLFAGWMQKARQYGDNDFVLDGLMNDEQFSEENWWDSNLRIVCISKDPYFTNSDELEEGDLNGEDYRGYNLLEMSEEKRFWKNILTMVYGIANTEAGAFPEYSEASSFETRANTWRDIPFAFVNIKKQAGDSTVSNSVLRDYARKYKEHLKEEIREIICPNVVYCCGTSGIVMDEIYDDVKFEQIDDIGYIFYNKEEKLLLIAGHHPTARIGNRDMYENVVKPYAEFLKDYIFPDN